ncbi:MAG: leucine-rich repeat domain-containing protein [Prevotella sp.]|nr:leucine-rich repeat domain-containing protein [Prevotella sp.]
MKKIQLLLALLVASVCSVQGTWAQGTEDNPIVVNLLEPGSLGTEVLYHVEHVKNVKYLKVTGEMNEDDWTTLSLMDSVIVADLGNATTSSSIIRHLFYNGKCAFLQSLILPQGLTEIGEEAFSYHPSLTNITFPSTPLKIGNSAFYRTKQLKEVILPDNVYDIGSSAFEESSALENVQLPIGIKTIPACCFRQCKKLKRCPLPNGITDIGYCAFSKCWSLNTRIPQSIKTIAVAAFEQCAIDSIFLPEGVTVNDASFNDNSNLVYIEFPTSFYGGINGTPIAGCSNLQTVVFKSPTVVNMNNFLYRINNKDIVIKVPDFVVPSYKLHSYWYNYQIEGINSAEINYWDIYQPLTLNNSRLEGTPTVHIMSTGSMKVNGDRAMTLDKFVTDINGANGNRAQVISNCENVNILGQYQHAFYSPAKKWFFLSLPFDVKVSDIVCQSGSKAMRYYDGAKRAQSGTGSNWKNYSADDIIPAGTGFIIQTSEGTIVDFYAQDNASKQYVFSNKEFVKSLAVNNSTTPANKGWNLVGNPWLCYYNIHKMNFTAPITVWNGSNYVAYSIIDDDYAIEPTQAFFVQCPDEINSISFPIDGRQLTSTIESQNAVRRKDRAQADRLLMDVELSDGDQGDKTRFVLNERASMDYETTCDASKFFSMNADVPQIYSVYDGVEYAINERPMADGVLTLGILIPTDGTYTIKAARNQMGEVFLVDKEVGVEANLADGEYTFHATAGQTESRFELRFSGVVVNGIDKMASTSSDDADYFNLNGQRIVNPTKGVYIVNGKKVIIK